MSSPIRRSRRLNKSTENREPMPQYFFAAFTGDRSGSMSSLNNASADGLYNWVKTMKETANENNQEGFISVTTFDDETNKLFNNVNVKSVNFSKEKAIEEMEPRGTTRLYDTAVEDIKQLLENVSIFRHNLHPEVKALDPKISISWVCCTDGQDNESSMYTSHDLKKYVTKARKKGVKCFFIAANQDAVTTGNNYGFRSDESMSFSANRENATNAFRNMSDNMRRVSSGSSNTPFTQAMRQSSLTPHDQNAYSQSNSIVSNLPTIQSMSHGAAALIRSNSPVMNSPSIFRQRNITLRQPPRIPRRQLIFRQ